MIRSLDPGADREAWLDAWRATGREPFAHPDYVALFAEDEDTILALLDEQPTGSVLLPLVRRRLPDALGAGSMPCHRTAMAAPLPQVHRTGASSTAACSRG